MKYKAIGFDWNGVIFGLPGSVFSQGAAEAVGIDIAAFRRSYFDNNYLRNKEGASNEVFWKAVLEDLKAQSKLPVLLDYINSFPGGTINKDVIEIIKKLKNNGYKLGIVSNATIEGGQKIKDSEVAQYFDEILISSEVRMMKPQKEMFEMIINKLGIKAEEFIFIDDAEKSLEKAPEIGFTPILFRDAADLKNRLTELGVYK